MTELLKNPLNIFALLGVLSLIIGFFRIKKETLSTRTLVIISLLLALSLILQQLRLFHMPQGGSVTLGAMVPLLLISFRFGTGTGLLAGFVYGLLNLLQNPFILHPIQVLFDYPLPFMSIGLAGIFHRSIYLGTALAFGLRFVCHVISGVAFFASYAPEGMSPLVYSVIFNGSYLMPEFLICALILHILPLQRLFKEMGGNR